MFVGLQKIPFKTQNLAADFTPILLSSLTATNAGYLARCRTLCVVALGMVSGSFHSVKGSSL